MFDIIRKGFMKIWKTIVRDEDLNVQFHEDIYSIQRQNDKVILNHQTGSSLKETTCGFLIWAAPVSEFLRLLDKLFWI